MCLLKVEYFLKLQETTLQQKVIADISAQILSLPIYQVDSTDDGERPNRCIARILQKPSITNCLNIRASLVEILSLKSVFIEKGSVFN